MSFGGFKTLEEKRAYHREYYRKRRETDPKYLADKGSLWRSKNIDKARESSKKYLYGAGYKEHKIRVKARRHKTSRQQISKIYKEQIKQIYRNCPEGYEVDHIIPINGKNVCGLHVPWNLQYLTSEDNLKKGNLLCLSNSVTFLQSPTSI